ncbi:TPA: YopX family protein [Bacillus mobilis]
MREIKFRAWVLKDEALDGLMEKTMEYDVESFHDPLYEYKRGNIILMQYTGLKDKNGKEIYEGDIVEHKDYSAGAIIFGGNQPTCKSVIRWKDYYNGYHLAGLGNPFKGEELEKIGNIYENPELLEESK